MEKHQQDAYYSLFSAPLFIFPPLLFTLKPTKYLKFKVIWIFFCIFYWNELSAKNICQTYKLCLQKLLVRYLVIAGLLSHFSCKKRITSDPLGHILSLSLQSLFSLCLYMCVCVHVYLCDMYWDLPATNYGWWNPLRQRRCRGATIRERTANFCSPGEYSAAHLLKLLHILWPR